MVHDHPLRRGDLFDSLGVYPAQKLYRDWSAILVSVVVAQWVRLKILIALMEVKGL